MTISIPEYEQKRNVKVKNSVNFSSVEVESTMTVFEIVEHRYYPGFIFCIMILRPLFVLVKSFFVLLLYCLLSAKI
jgi:hypothetical protein